MTNESHPGRSTDVDADEPLAPAAMLALLTNQQRSVQSQMGGFVPLITGAWGIAWLIGFLALWSIDGLRPGFALPLAAAVWIFVVCTVVAIGLSMWLGIRSGRGIRPGSDGAFSGTVYGVTWSVGSISIAAFGGALDSHGMTPELANFFYPIAYVLFAGIMYLLAGAIWHAVPSVVQGGVIVLVALVAAFLPYPWHFLFLAIAGGGSFLVLALVAWLYLRRTRFVVTAGAAQHV
jgi:hypothetical protein